MHADCDDDEVLVQTIGLFAAALQQLLQQHQQQEQQTEGQQRPGLMDDVAAAAAAAAAEELGICPLPLLQQLQLPLLPSATVLLLRAAAPQLRVLRLVHAESHRCGQNPKP